MSLQPIATTGCSTAAVAAAGCSCLPCRSGSGTTSGTIARRERPRDRSTRLRPRDHPLRPREQLRAAVRLRGGELRPDLQARPTALPRRARHLDQGRLRHVARPLRQWRRRRSTCSRASTNRCAHGPRVRRHLLLAPLRPRHAARGDDWRTRHGGEAGQGALRRHLLLLARARPARRRRSCASSARRS